jgi:hypothetical protein
MPGAGKGAGGVGDPGLGARDPPDLAIPDRAGAQRAQVGAGLGLGEHGCRDDLAGGDARQEAGLLVVGPVGDQQFGGDLRAGAQRSGPDVAPRQGLGDDAHRHLAEPRTAPGLRRRKAEHAQLSHLLDQGQRDQLVAQVPAVGEGRDLLGGETGELVADRLQGLVEATGLQRRPAAGLVEQLDDARLHGLGRAGGQQRNQRLQPVRGDIQIGGAEHLPLVHRQAARQLGEVFVRQQLGRQRLSLAEGFLGHKAFGPGRSLAQGLGIGRRPGEAMGHVLLGVQRRAVEPAVAAHAFAHGVLQLGDQHLSLAAGAVQEFRQVGEDQAHGTTL